MSESALSAPVKRFLTGLGFSVKGEIDGCDIVAIHHGAPPLLVIAELKLGLSFELILQAVDRLTAADEVWLAVPQTRKGRDRDRRARRLCQLLGVGLLTVNLKTGHVEPECRPGPYRPRLDKAWRSKLVREFENRRGDPMEGGISRRRIMTAYRQTCLALAAALQAGPMRPRDLAEVSAKAGVMLRANVYGWFERTAPATYGLTKLGAQEVAHFLAAEEAAGKAGGSDGVQGSDR